MYQYLGWEWTTYVHLGRVSGQMEEVWRIGVVPQDWKDAELTIGQDRWLDEMWKLL